MVRKLFLSAFALVMLLSLIAAQACGGAGGGAQASQIEDAIVKGLAWLAGQQQPGGSWQFINGLDQPRFDVATTGLAVLKFEDRAKELGKDPFDTVNYVYAQNVIDGLDYIFTYLTTDSDPGFHYPSFVAFGGNASSDVYTTGIVMAAVAASNNPPRTITTGALSTAAPNGLGLTYQDALQGMMDWMAFAQDSVGAGGTESGGWPYTPTNRGWADNSVSGYATLGIGSAHAQPPDGFGLSIPALVTTGLNIWIPKIQCADPALDGGSYYQTGTPHVNTLKTGNLIYELALAGFNQNDPRVTRALDFIGNRWGLNGGDTDGAGWRGDYQAMFTMMKGLQAYGFTNLPVQNWFDEVSTYIVDNQKPDGHWESVQGSASDVWGAGCSAITTAWALLTLERAVPQISLNQTPTPTPTSTCNCTPTWSIMPIPVPNGLADVWGSSASDVYVVGTNGLILHYDGNNLGTWTGPNSPAAEDLNGIWGSSSNNVWVVGDIGTILHYTGTNWIQITPNPTPNDLWGVWGSSPTDVWAVGDIGTILHYTGTNWIQITPNPTPNRLRDVWGSSPTDVWAVGDNGTILHYLNGAWNSVPNIPPTNLHGIWGSSSTDVWAVGDNGTTLHYTGTNWIKITPSPATNPTNPLLDIWGSSSSDIFIGEVGSDVPHYSGGYIWTLMPSGTSQHEFSGVWGNSPCDVYVVGSDGIILHYCCPPVAATHTPTTTNTSSPTSTLSACNCSTWSPVTVTWNGASPETQTISCGNTVTIPWIYNEWVLIDTSGISCYPANCNATYNWSVWKSGTQVDYGSCSQQDLQPFKMAENGHKATPGLYAVNLNALCGGTPCSGCRFYVDIGNQSSCAQTINYSACNCDNFSAPIESPSPSAALLSWINTNIGSGSIPGSRGCDDNTTLNQYWAHTFQTWVPPTGCQIQSAILTLQVHNGDTNDALALGFISGGQTWSLWQYLTDLGVPVGSDGQIVLDLGNLPGALSLLADIQYFGCLDVAVEDDSGVDCATLEVTYGP